MRIFLIALAAAAVSLSGCGGKKVKVAKRPTSHRPAVTAPPPKIGDVEVGVASWYGHPYHGRAAANGEIYDMEKLTAAHRTLPFNTWVRVENLMNHRTVDVRIIDRGPFVDNRAIDLSHAAAQQIELIGPGVARVRIVVISPPVVMEASIFAVQTGIFRDKSNADKMQADMQARYGLARVVERQGSPPTWRVLVGQESTPESAEALAIRIRGDISLPEAFVVRVDAP